MNCKACEEIPSAEEGWTRHQENVAKPPYWSGRGGVGQEMNLIEMDQPPRLREFRLLRDIILIAQPPLLS